MLVDREFARHVLNLLGDIFTDAYLLGATAADLIFVGKIVANFRARKLFRYLPPAMPSLLLLLGGLFVRWSHTTLKRNQPYSTVIKKVLLPGCLRQMLPLRSQPETLHCLILLFEAIVGSLQFPVGRACLVELTLQVSELNLHLMELLENTAKQFLTGGQIIRDLGMSLHHN
jgi:hypothetical protein